MIYINHSAGPDQKVLQGKDGCEETLMKGLEGFFKANKYRQGD